MNQLQKMLQTVSKSLQELSKKVESIQKQIGSAKKKVAKKVPLKAKPRIVSKAPKAAKTKKSAPKAKAKKESSTGTAYDLFLKAFEGGNSGLSISDLKSKTGFDDKKVANLVYKAKKQGKIKNVDKGIYSKV